MQCGSRQVWHRQACGQHVCVMVGKAKGARAVGKVCRVGAGRVGEGRVGCRQGQGWGGEVMQRCGVACHGRHASLNEHLGGTTEGSQPPCQTVLVPVLPVPVPSLWERGERREREMVCPRPKKGAKCAPAKEGMKPCKALVEA